MRRRERITKRDDRPARRFIHFLLSAVYTRSYRFSFCIRRPARTSATAVSGRRGICQDYIRIYARWIINSRGGGGRAKKDEKKFRRKADDDDDARTQWPDEYNLSCLPATSLESDQEAALNDGAFNRGRGGRVEKPYIKGSSGRRAKQKGGY